MVTHTDLKDNVWNNRNVSITSSFTNDYHGWDFFNNDNTVFDGPDGHGTHVAGTIGAVGNNGQHVAGVCWSGLLMISGKVRASDPVCCHVM
jgi:serine protease